MGLLDRLKADRLSARKGKEVIKSKLLTTLLGDIEQLGMKPGRNVKDITEIEIASVIEKFIKNIDFTLTKLSEPSVNLEFEREVLKLYLPTKMSIKELKVEVLKIISDNDLSIPSNMGFVMGELKKNFLGLYDGRLASTLVKELLKR
jgi:uncharacterized protein YqeY